MDGRADGARVDIDGARDKVEAFSKLDGGARNVEAAEGSGRGAVDGFGGVLSVVVGLGCEGRGMW